VSTSTGVPRAVIIHQFCATGIDDDDDAHEERNANAQMKSMFAYCLK